MRILLKIVFGGSAVLAITVILPLSGVILPDGGTLDAIHYQLSLSPYYNITFLFLVSAIAVMFAWCLGKSMHSEKKRVIIQIATFTAVLLPSILVTAPLVLFIAPVVLGWYVSKDATNKIKKVVLWIVVATVSSFSVIYVFSVLVDSNCSQFYDMPNIFHLHQQMFGIIECTPETIPYTLDILEQS